MNRYGQHIGTLINSASKDSLSPLVRKGDSLNISDAGYYLTWIYTPIENYRKKYFILPCSEFENKPDFFSNPADYNQMKKFINDSRGLLYKRNIKIKEYIYSDNNLILN